MMPISTILTQRAMTALSVRSAKVPDAREQEERRDEDRAREHHQRAGLHAGLRREREGHVDAQGALQQVVVEGAEELRDEERREAARGEQRAERRGHGSGLRGC